MYEKLKAGMRGHSCPLSILLGTGGPPFHLAVDPGTLASSPYLFIIACANPMHKRLRSKVKFIWDSDASQDVQACGGSVIVGHGHWHKSQKQNNNSREVREVEEVNEEEVIEEEVRIFQDQKNQLTQPTPEVSNCGFGSG